MFQHHSLDSVCLWRILWKIVLVLTLKPQHIGGPLLPILCSVLIRSLNFIVFMWSVQFVTAWIIHELSVVECNVTNWICIWLQPSWRLNVADPFIDSVDDVLLVIKSLTVKVFSIEWHWDIIFISDYTECSLFAYQ